jgi:hypothetical protein
MKLKMTLKNGLHYPKDRQERGRELKHEGLRRQKRHMGEAQGMEEVDAVLPKLKIKKGSS